MSDGSEQKSLGPRQYLLAAGLASAVAATMWAAQLEEDGGEAAAGLAAPTRAASRPAAQAASAAPAWSLAERAPWPEASGTQLAAWSPPPPPPPPPPPVAAAPVAPVDPGPPPAPPFPYQLIGRMEEAGAPAQALLASGNRSLSAKAGDVIDGQWRVDSVGPSGLALTWLPGQQTQTLTFRPS